MKPKSSENDTPLSGTRKVNSFSNSVTDIQVSCARFSSGVHAYYTEDDGAYDSGESLSEEEEYQTGLPKMEHSLTFGQHSPGNNTTSLVRLTAEFLPRNKRILRSLPRRDKTLWHNPPTTTFPLVQPTFQLFLIFTRAKEVETRSATCCTVHARHIRRKDCCHCREVDNPEDPAKNEWGSWTGKRSNDLLRARRLQHTLYKKAHVTSV